MKKISVFALIASIASALVVKSADRSISLVEPDLTLVTTDIKLAPEDALIFQYVVAADFTENLV